MHSERRATPRKRLAFPVLIEGPFGLRRCIARDVSARGLFIETPETYPVGASVRVTFALPDGTWEMTLRCKVRHVTPSNILDGMLHGLGLSFEAPEEAQEDDEDAPGSVPQSSREHA